MQSCGSIAYLGLLTTDLLLLIVFCWKLFYVYHSLKLKSKQMGFLKQNIKSGSNVGAC